MAFANHVDENLIERFKHLIAEKDAENKELKATMEKKKAANDRMERENAEIELKIEANEKKIKEDEQMIYEKMVSINSRCVIANCLTNAKEMETIICGQPEFCVEAVAKFSKFENTLETYTNELERKLKELQTITNCQMNAIFSTENRMAEMDSYEKKFEDAVRSIDETAKAKLEQLDISIAEEQERKMRNAQMLAELESGISGNSRLDSRLDSCAASK